MPESVDDANLHRVIQDLLAQHDKLEVIRLVRQQTGLGLAEAKAAVDSVERSEPISSGHSDSPLRADFEEDLLELLRAGRKIQAIKVYRDTVQCDLRTAKQAIEQLAETHHIESSRSGCSIVAPVLIGLVLTGGGWLSSWLAG